ncbi:hypothetical protein MMOR_09220 [Mycolicibacterium moriokaense]|uniref:Uncharacterized protein n=1 Tax=Mycolicibacterium moriokaense TaxID=39691 RepID=A0AAD1M4T8_9MYCO|nr:hypothetical protein MMOR_09220 [Mycolicibacterium moriokaense]
MIPAPTMTTSDDVRTLSISDSVVTGSVWSASHSEDMRPDLPGVRLIKRETPVVTARREFGRDRTMALPHAAVWVAALT